MISQTKSDKSCVLSCFWHRRCIWQRHRRRVPLVARTLLKKFYPKCWPCGWPTSFVIRLTTTLLQVPGLHNDRKPISTGSRIGFGNATVYLTSCICILSLLWIKWRVYTEIRLQYQQDPTLNPMSPYVDPAQLLCHCIPSEVDSGMHISHITLQSCNHAVMQSQRHAGTFSTLPGQSIQAWWHSVKLLSWGCSLLRQDVHGSLCPYSR